MNYPQDKKSLKKYLKEKSLPTISENMMEAGLSVREINFIILRFKKKHSITEIVCDKGVSESAVYRTINCGMEQLLDFFMIKNSQKI